MDSEEQKRKEWNIHSLEQYQKELADWGRQWILHYCNAAIDTSPEGEISLIKGKLLFKKELACLCEKAFSQQDIIAYQKRTENLMEWMEEIHDKSRQHISDGGMITMEYVYQVFGFDPFEWYLFCMAYMAELDAQFERIYVLLQDDFEKKAPTIDLCIRMYTLEEEKQYALKQHVVERWEFLSQFFAVEQEEKPNNKKSESILATSLQLDQRMVKFLYDMDSKDSLLKEAVTCYLPEDTKQPMLIRQEKVEILKRMYSAAGRKEFVYLSGEQDIGKKFLIKHLSKSLKRPLLLVDMNRFQELQQPMGWLIRRLAREAVLKGNAMVCLADIEIETEQGEPDYSLMEGLLHHLRGTHLIPLFTSRQKWQEAIQTSGCQCMELKLPPLTLEERNILWKELVLKSELKGAVDTAQLAGTYQLPPGAIGRVIREAQIRLLIEQQENHLERMLYEGCQRQLIHSLGKDAVRVPAHYTMEELILPKAQKSLLRDACNMVKYHHHVFETWGFHQKMAYGKGVSMIFYGPPGTGKTMGAQAIAHELNLELYRVDMASVLSKYVGESEKKLGNIFEQGAKSQSILFFDEADALFGKRSEVKDSQDKYANASTAFLLQKLEEYEGIIILATNLLQNFDQAFCRRFQFIIEFPFPDEQRREEIWRRVFPEELPKEEIDYQYLAEEFVLSGSQIKNIAVGAAFLAAGEKGELQMVHILKTIKREMKKNGKNMIASDFGAYYSLMEGEGGESQYE